MLGAVQVRMCKHTSLQQTVHGQKVCCALAPKRLQRRQHACGDLQVLCRTNACAAHSLSTRLNHETARLHRWHLLPTAVTGSTERPLPGYQQWSGFAAIGSTEPKPQTMKIVNGLGAALLRPTGETLKSAARDTHFAEIPM